MGLADLVPDDAPRQVKTKVVAGWLGIHESTVLAWSRQGKLPKPTPLSRRILMFDTAKVRLFLQCLDLGGDSS